MQAESVAIGIDRRFIVEVFVIVESGKFDILEERDVSIKDVSGTHLDAHLHDFKLALDFVIVVVLFQFLP